MNPKLLELVAHEVGETTTDPLASFFDALAHVLTDLFAFAQGFLQQLFAAFLF